MACEYLFEGKHYKSYDLLLKDLSEIDINTAISIMFSLNLDKQKEVAEKIDELKHLYKLTPFSISPSSYSSLSGDPDIQIPEGYYTTQTFIDSGHYLINGDAPVFRLNTEEYLLLEKEKFKNLGLSDQQALEKCEQIKNNDERIAKDAYDLHRILITSHKDHDDRHFSGASINTSFSSIYDLLGPLVRDIEKNIRMKNAGGLLKLNINLTADIKGLSEKIIGHIDYLMVKEDGSIEIFNIKASTQNESEWTGIKKEKYKHQLALIKRILEFNGIDARKIRLNIIPVKMTYDDDFKNILEISADKPISYDQKDYIYTFQKYDIASAQFIESNAKIEDLDDTVFEKVNNQLNKIFAGRDIDIRFTGIKESAKSWINHHWKLIARYAEGKKGWEIKLPGEKEFIYIEDTRIGSDNEQLVNLIMDREEELFNNTSREIGTSRLIEDILHSYRHEYNSFRGRNQNNDVLERLINKYFEKDSKGNYKWTLLENLEVLNNANVILFKHKVTNQLDVFVVSPFDISLESKVNKRDNLLGNYIPDLNSYNFTMKSNFGNIEAVRILTLLNEVIPKLDFEAKLGDMRIVSLSLHRKKQGCEFSIGLLLSDFDTIVNITNSNNNGLNIINNFKSKEVLIIDPALLFIQTWREVLDSAPTSDLLELKGLSEEISQKILKDGTTIDGLETIKTIEGKIEKLNIIIERLTKYAESRGISLSAKTLIHNCKSENIEKASVSKVYVAAVNALNKYHGDISIENEEFSLMSEYLLKTLSIPNTNVRTVGYMFQKSVNKIANQMLDRYSSIKEIILQYYKDCGYTDLQNSLIGNLAKLFENLYEILDGKKTMKFKNPYSLNSELKEYERKFLKNILLEFNKIRFEMHGKEWIYSGVNDPKLLEDINSGVVSNYFDVPLEKASNATRRSKIVNGIKEFGKRWMKRIMHPKDAFKEFSENLLSDSEKESRDNDIQNLSAYNPFKILDGSNNNIRVNMITEKQNLYGDNYFETNVENLIIDFLEKHLLSVEYNKMLVRTKGILLDLYLKGEAGDNPKAVEHTVKTIEDFLSVSVFNKSIMEESSLAIEAYLEPIRKAVSKCYIAANPVAAVRDTIQGLLENTIRALNKFQTDIDVKDVMYGYKEVITEGPTSPNKIVKMNLLNLKYRFSNLDVARISEGQKTGRSGVLNFDNLAYSTLRSPDYLNRMVLFSARMHHDGVDDAYYIENGKLVYNWRKDKRFEAYARNDKSDQKKYAQQRSLYLSLMRQFNQENGTKLTENDDLPDAYTLAQIETFKTFADNIYGSYNLSTRAKYENTAIGRNFAVFSTWMNGIVDVYIKGRQISKGESKWVQETNANGENLYFDSVGNVVTLAEGGDETMPVMKDVPVMVLGIFKTYSDAFKELYTGGWNNFKSSIWENEMHRRNFRKSWTDLLVSAILAMMFRMFIDPSYKEHKKKGDGENFIVNGITEILYKASSSCWDGFKGPFTILTYFGESTNPATYSLGKKVITDGYNLLLGKRTFGEVLMGSVALPRSFLDTYKMWVRDTQ